MSGVNVMRRIVILSYGSVFGALALLVACGSEPPSSAPKAPVLPGGGGEGGDTGAAGTSNGGADCVPRTCESSGVVCGLLDDGCGARVRCDMGCEGTGGEGGGASCEPRTCAERNANCGTIVDGCGIELECGSCRGDESCGAVVDNVCGCPPQNAVFELPPRTARTATSAGFAGDEAAYSELYDVTCETDDDCVEACTERGGETAMCEASSCAENAAGGQDCLPAPIWTNLEGIRTRSDGVSGAVTLVAVNNTYQDRLLATDFALEVPEAAVVRGLTVEIRRAGELSIADGSVRILKRGSLGALERATSEPWPDELEYTTYGGPDDLWGEAWTPADLNDDAFGVAIAVDYENTVGNARAYVDQVRVTVHYSVVCGS
jgi:hypothetical protein